MHLGMKREGGRLSAHIANSSLLLLTKDFGQEGLCFRAYARSPSPAALREEPFSLLSEKEVTLPRGENMILHLTVLLRKATADGGYDQNL